MVRQAERSSASMAAIVTSARELFSRSGYHDVTIDQVAERAGLAKGSVYYHFGSKLDLFDHVLDDLQHSLADALAARPRPATPATAQSIAAGIQAYLHAANRPTIRQILLVDGPVVLGWQRWREIDDKHFAHTVRGGLRQIMDPTATDVRLRSATSLIMGAIMEAAIDSGTSKRPSKTVEVHCATIELLLTGLAAT
jgi:AcrR family transcriptional regulator